MDFKKAKNFHSASFKKESCELSHSQKKNVTLTLMAFQMLLIWDF